MWAQMKMTFLVLATFVYFAFWNSTFTMYAHYFNNLHIYKPSNSCSMLRSALFCSLSSPIYTDYLLKVCPFGLLIIFRRFQWSSPRFLQKITFQSELEKFSSDIVNTNTCSAYKRMMQICFFLRSVVGWMDVFLYCMGQESALFHFFAFPTNFAMSTLAPPPHSLWPTMSKC